MSNSGTHVELFSEDFNFLCKIEGLLDSRKAILIYYEQMERYSAYCNAVCKSRMASRGTAAERRAERPQAKESRLCDMGRRAFIGSALGAVAASGCATVKSVAKIPEYDFKWVSLIHLGRKMWGDLPRAIDVDRTANKTRILTDEEFAALTTPERLRLDRLHFEVPFWEELSLKLRECGCNTIMLDVGEGLIYPSHPELAVEGSWTPDRLKDEVDRLRGMGFEVFPKLNFSTCHDAWLGPYERMVSTPKYYEVCSEVIRDTMEVFAGAKCLHIGFDEEEQIGNQQSSSLVMFRQGDLWWHDINWFVREVERHGARAWIWSDYARRHPFDEFCRRMPKTVVQNPWTYWAVKAKMASDPLIRLYRTLADAGYDVAPCGSNCYGVTENFPAMAEYCKATLPPERFKGMIMATWIKTVEPCRRLHWQAAGLIAEAIRITNGNG